MPWCPSCRQEYRAGIAACADCGTTLVDDLGAHETEQRAAAAAQVLRIVAPAGTLAGLQAGLKEKKVPFRHDAAGGALLVPMAAAEQIEASLSQVAEYERVGDVLHVYGARQDREADLPQDPAWLTRSHDELVKEVGAAVPGLFAWLSSPIAKKANAAAARLAGLAAAGAFKVEAVMAWAAKENLRKPLFAWAELLAAEPPNGLAASLARLASTSESRVAGALLHVIAKLRDVTAVAAVLPLLDHADVDLRDDADEVLVSLAGIDVGFDAEALPAVRAAKIRLWREWIERARRK
ncbi:MAG: hypothetical protein EXS13_11620 [Planctomycetes bacterium]|nr:hypothetical protein [Planctomycetota bacterium]